jgi:hypothetical protein
VCRRSRDAGRIDRRRSHFGTRDVFSRDFVLIFQGPRGGGGPPGGAVKARACRGSCQRDSKHFQSRLARRNLVRSWGLRLLQECADVQSDSRPTGRWQRRSLVTNAQ